VAKTAEYGLGEFTFARGWFMVAESSEVQDKPLPVRYFGKDLVLYRGKDSGRVIMMDAYCPHMGAHLGHNETSYIVRDKQHIEGDSIRCPFHGWRYGPDGKCNEIPYYDGPIPKAACVQTWPVIERTGVIFVWHDPEGGQPDYELHPIPEWDEPSWVRWKIDLMGVLESHGQEIVDNMADIAHMGPIHGSTACAYFENEFRGPVVIQRFGAGHRTLVNSGDALLELETWYAGPGVLTSRMLGAYPTVMMIAHTPIDDGVIKVWHSLMVKSTHAVATEEDVAAARAYQEQSRLALAQDFDIWKYKRPCFNVLQVPTDGPYHKVRIWYKQFYNPRARAEDFQKRVDGISPVKGAGAAPEDMVRHQYLVKVA
jgi:3-ketosteroid 9alpha-monooxygenase subunit A